MEVLKSQPWEAKSRRDVGRGVKGVPAVVRVVQKDAERPVFRWPPRQFEVARILVSRIRRNFRAMCWEFGTSTPLLV